MNQATAIVTVLIAVGVSLLIVVSNELRLMRKPPSKMYPWPETGTVALLDMDEYEYELAVQDRDEWDAQAYRMYMEEV